MSSVEIELNSAGVKALLQSKEAMDICKQLADQTRAKLGSGYEVTTMTGRFRANASIEAVTHAARKENAENNTILKALR